MHHRLGAAPAWQKPTFATLAMSQIRGDPRYAGFADLARLQRKQEQFPKGSPERGKVMWALQHAYQWATNRRRNFAHQALRKLVNVCQLNSAP